MYSGRTLNQTFIGELGKIDQKLLHSFVSKNPITNPEFKTALSRLIFVVGFSADSQNIKQRILSEFPTTIFSRTKSPTTFRTQLSQNSVHNQFENLRQELYDENVKLRKEIESMRQEFVVATAANTANDDQTGIFRRDLVAAPQWYKSFQN